MRKSTGQEIGFWHSHSLPLAAPIVASMIFGYRLIRELLGISEAAWVQADRHRAFTGLLNERFGPPPEIGLDHFGGDCLAVFSVDTLVCFHGRLKSRRSTNN
jgi:hypothetical protein